MGKKGPLWWRESDWLLRGSSAANQILLRHSGPILSYGLNKCAQKINPSRNRIYVFVEVIFNGRGRNYKSYLTFQLLSNFKSK